MKFSEIRVGQAYMVKGGATPYMIQSLIRYSNLSANTTFWREDAKGMYVKAHSFNHFRQHDSKIVVSTDFVHVRITQFEMTWDEYKIKAQSQLEAKARRYQNNTDMRELQKRAAVIIADLTGKNISQYSAFDDVQSWQYLLRVLDAAANNPDVVAQLKQPKELIIYSAKHFQE